jgi:diaminopimelate decarboxylase
MKANVNEPILQIIKDFGFRADCVSGNEVKRALELAFPLMRSFFRWWEKPIGKSGCPCKMVSYG